GFLLPPVSHANDGTGMSRNHEVSDESDMLEQPVSSRAAPITVQLSVRTCCCVISPLPPALSLHLSPVRRSPAPPCRLQPRGRAQRPPRRHRRSRRASPARNCGTAT